MNSGVRKSGCPIPRLMMSRPWAARCVARASTAKAFSSPMRSKAATVFNMTTSWRIASGEWRMEPFAIRYSPFAFCLGPAHHRRHQLLDRRRADLLHHGVGFDAQTLEHALDAGLAEGAEAPDIGAAHAHRGRAQAQRLDDVGAAAEAGIDEDRHAAFHRFDDFRQRVDGRASRIFAARAMI